jgi:hypothetical protein
MLENDVSLQPWRGWSLGLCFGFQYDKITAPNLQIIFKFCRWQVHAGLNLSTLIWYMDNRLFALEV